MFIDSLDTVSAPDMYFEHAFRVVLEDHISYLRKHEQTQIFQIEPFIASKYRGDLFSLLQHYGINSALFWVVMRMNGMTTPTDADELLGNLLIPSYNVVERIRNTFMTQNKIKT